MTYSFSDIKKYVKKRIENVEVNRFPFYSLYIDEIFPSDFYQDLKDKMLYFKYNEPLQERNWDNPSFINKRFQLKNINDPVINIVRSVFSDLEITRSIMIKFYYEDYSTEVELNRDFQFVFTDKDRFQKIHTDIPAQIITANFYLPENSLTQQEELDNGTIVYDKYLNPCRVFRYKDNSVAFFAPHFYSYHGFNTTINNRNTLLFFYSQNDLIKRFYDNSKNQNDEQSPEKFKDVIQWKLSKYRLIEYGENDMDFLTKLLTEKQNCKVNSLNGRID